MFEAVRMAVFKLCAAARCSVFYAGPAAAGPTSKGDETGAPHSTGQGTGRARGGEADMKAAFPPIELYTEGDNVTPLPQYCKERQCYCEVTV